MFSAYIYYTTKKCSLYHIILLSSTLLNSIAPAQCRMFVCTLKLISVNIFNIIMNQTWYMKIYNTRVFCTPDTCVRF